MRTSFVSVLAVASTVVAQSGYEVSQIPDGQIQAPTSMAAAPVPYSSSVEVAPEPAVSTPVEMSSSYVAVPTTAVVPVPVPSYPAGNGTVVAPSGSAPVASGSPASPTGASDTDVAALPEQTVNAAGMVGVPAVGAVIAGLMALFA